jgi:hypothetical protein
VTAAGEDARIVPWERRVCDALALAPISLGLAIALGTCTIAALYLWIVSRFGLSSIERAFEGFWFELVFALLMGFAPTALVYSMRGSARDLEDLLPALRCPEAVLDRLRDEIASLNRRGLWLGALVGFGFGLGVVLHPSGWAEGMPGAGDPVVTWIVVRNTLIFTLYGRTVFTDFSGARTFSRIGAEWVRIDLLDPGRTTPFARRGLRSVLLFVVPFSLASLLLLAPWASYLTLVSMGIVVAVALPALLLPVLGVHRRIRETKGEELERLRLAIGGDRQALEGSRIAAEAETARLADLLAYRSYVESVSEWPFDAPALLRFALYLAIPLGSWLGGALVERLLGTALD